MHLDCFPTNKMISFGLSQYWEEGFKDHLSFEAGDVGISRATPGLRLPRDAAGWCRELQAGERVQFRAICIPPP